MSGDVLIEVRETGDAVVTVRQTIEGKKLRIERADPVILVSDALLAELEREGIFGEGIFVIRAVNGTVRYELTERRPEQSAWLATRITPWVRALAQHRWVDHGGKVR